MKFRQFCVTAVIGLALLAHAASGAAQQPFSLQIQNGSVTLHAQNAQVRLILAEWARLGGTTIVNGDNVNGAPVTLNLQAVPERQALDILLRGVAGYVLAARPANTAGISAFDRIVILASSAAPRLPQTPAFGVPVAQRQFAPPPLALGPTPETQDDNPPDDFGAGDVRRVPDPRGAGIANPGIANPGIANPGIANPGIANPANVNVPPQFVQPVAVQQPAVQGGAAPGVVSPVPAPVAGANAGAPGAVQPQPGNPFGVPSGSSSMPGVVTPVPPQPSAAPLLTTRPPGPTRDPNAN